jgi:hypothetical protein
MEIETSVLDISGSIYVRIPSNMADFFKLKGDTKARISDKSNREAIIVFP